MKKGKQTDLFVDNAEVAKARSRRVRWKSTFRLIPTRFPPIDLFERIADPSDWEAIMELEGMTNPRIREGANAISLVPNSKRVSGPGSTIVMAPFTHASLDRPTRFSDGQYGIYYAGQKFETSLFEVSFHMGRFYAATNDPAMQVAYRGYEGKIDKPMHDITKGKWKHLLEPDVNQYGEPQHFAKTLRDSGSNGIVYPSVRHKGGLCIAAFWPNVVDIPKQTKHIQLHWDGVAISKWYDFESEKWHEL